MSLNYAMKTQNNPAVHDEFTQRLLMGLDKAFENLIEFKKQKNSVLVVSKDNQIVFLQPEEMEKIYKQSKDK